ncbi:MAG: Ig-like domain-containing protein, partial [Pseudomonadota bacterium]
MKKTDLFCVVHSLSVYLCFSCASTGQEDEKVLPSHCNPLSEGPCLTPWPSSFYLKEDSTTVTGYRVNYPTEAMPKNRDGKPIDPARFNVLDGFSIGSQVVVYFKAGVSKEGLPKVEDLEYSISDQSPIWILEHDTGVRVPFFAETDANAKGSFVPALIIRPQVPLKHNSRYIVVIKEGLKNASGASLQPPDPFLRLRDKESTSRETLRAEGERLKAVFE